MNLPANVKLSQVEFELVNNTDWILTKQVIIDKVVTMFGSLHEEYKQMLAKAGLDALLRPSGKIYKGEQYEGLPYVMLDLPRIFGKEDVLAIRTFFWWGNFFSITLHVSGVYKRMLEHVKKEQFKQWYVGVNEDPWQHHFRADNYVQYENGAFDLKSRTHIKLSKKIPLSEWDQAYGFCIKNFSELISSLSDGRGLLPGIPITGSDL